MARGMSTTSGTSRRGRWAEDSSTSFHIAESGLERFTISRDNGWVGIGTTAPAVTLDVQRDGANARFMDMAQNRGSGRALLYVRTPNDAINSDGIGMFGVGDSADVTEEGNLFRVEQGGNVGIGTVDPSYPLEMASGAHVTAGGVWTDASSRALKQHITDLPLSAATAAVAGLTPVTYQYKRDPTETHVGFIAEDVPDLVAMNDRKGIAAIEITALLTKVVQEQQRQIAALESRLEAIEGNR